MTASILLALALSLTPLPASLTPEAAATEFLEAFKSMDEARFDAFFADEVTLFFPDGRFPERRVEGREAVLASFHRFFALLRSEGTTALDINPIDQRVQIYGEVAIVTFELNRGEAVGRRTIILRRMDQGWRIVHFHASVIDG